MLPPQLDAALVAAGALWDGGVLRATASQLDAADAACGGTRRIIVGRLDSAGLAFAWVARGPPPATGEFSPFYDGPADRADLTRHAQQLATWLVATNSVVASQFAAATEVGPARRSHTSECFTVMHNT